MLGPSRPAWSRASLTECAVWTPPHTHKWIPEKSLCPCPGDLEKICSCRCAREKRAPAQIQLQTAPVHERTRTPLQRQEDYILQRNLSKTEPSLSTPVSWWGRDLPVWAKSNFSGRSSPRDVAVREAHRSLVASRRSNYDFKELRVSGCLSDAYDLKAPRPSRKGDVQWPGSLVMGPTSLGTCMKRCKATRGCGAVATFFLQRKTPQNREKQAFCVLRKKECLLDQQWRPRYGSCRLKSEWCAFELRRRTRPLPPWAPKHIPAPCLAAHQTHVQTDAADLKPLLPDIPRDDAAHERTASFDREAWLRLPNDAVDPANSPSQRTIWYTHTVLGGGLNNMLMNVAQLLVFTCTATDALVMPRFDADPLWRLNAGTRNRSWLGRAPLRFDELFDFQHFQTAIAPCSVMLEPPKGATVQYTVPTHLSEVSAATQKMGHQFSWWATVSQWGSPAVTRALERVYRAVRPSPAVQKLVDALTQAAIRSAGHRWSAVHLPIEEDWWFNGAVGSLGGWCAPRFYEGYTRRCFTPAEVAQLTQQKRREHASTGTVLLYAADKVSQDGPSLCFEMFGERAAKLALDAEIPYTFRNAAELFLASIAPAGFFGNAYSTFSKAVGIMRAAASPEAHNASWAYDCALAESRSRWEALWRAESIVASHPGFAKLQTLPGNCAG